VPIDSVAFVNATRNCLNVRNGREAVELLSRSSRIREDLMKALEYSGSFPVSIILRAWHPMEAHQEFRGFVYNRQLTALTQYCYYQCFPVRISIHSSIAISFVCVGSNSNYNHNQFAMILYVVCKHYGIM
jgi:hypothetical protein